MKLLFLGTGTSVGVPMIGCDCNVCTSDDPRNHRARASAFVTHGNTHVVIDTAPEFRLQALQFRLRKLDGVLFTHAHADHLFGFDDLRRFNHIQHEPISVYGTPTTLTSVRHIFSYAFGTVQPGGTKPEVELHPVTDTFTVGTMTITPIPVMHGRMEVTAYRIGSLAYVTDVSAISDSSRDMLRNLDVLVLGALRFRPHPTHMSISEALDVIDDLRPKRALLTHLSHEVEHRATNATLPAHVRLAYDGLNVEIPC